MKLGRQGQFVQANIREDLSGHVQLLFAASGDIP